MEDGSAALGPWCSIMWVQAAQWRQLCFVCVVGAVDCSLFFLIKIMPCVCCPLACACRRCLWTRSPRSLSWTRARCRACRSELQSECPPKQAGFDQSAHQTAVGEEQRLSWLRRGAGSRQDAQAAVAQKPEREVQGVKVAVTLMAHRELQGSKVAVAAFQKLGEGQQLSDA